MTKTIFIGVVALPFLVSGAEAANSLTDPQLDKVTAGQVLDICPSCTGTLTSASSNSANGVTTSNKSVVIVGSSTGSDGTGGSGSGAGGSGTGTGGSGTGTGGSGTGTGGSTPPGPSGPSVVTTIAAPASATAIIGAATALTLTLH